MKINFATNNIYQSKNKNNISFGGARSDKIKHALTDDDDFILKQYYNDIKDIKPLSRKEERRLGEQIMQGGEKAEEAKQILITSALPSIVYYALQLKRYGFPLADTIQEANLSVLTLMNEVPYDGRKPFLNYIFDTVYRRTHKAIAEKSRTITLPLYIFDNVQIIKDTEAKLGKRLQRIPTDAEIARQTESRESYIKTLKKVGQPIEKLNKKNIRQLNEINKILNRKYEDEIVRKIDRKQLRKDLYLSFFKAKLTPLEKLAIISRFNLDGGAENNTLAKIGQKYNITRERVRQLIENGLFKLSNFQGKRSNNIKLKEYLEYQDLSS